MHKQSFFYGQGATEYLVVLSVVLIIGLVSVSLLGFFPGTASGISETASQAYWQGEAAPFRVNEANLVGDSQFAFALENAGADAVTLVGVMVNGNLASFGEYGTTYSNSSAVYFSQGEKKMVGIAASGFDCAAGKVGAMDFSMTYRTQYGTEFTQGGETKLALKCAVDSGTYAGSGGAQALNITTPRILPTAYVHQPYSTVFSASGGTPPYTWACGAPPCPGSPPMQISANGQLTWADPLAPGSTGFPVIVTDGTGNSTSKDFVINIEN